ncbi:hypothetical protein Fcan01_19886 [Folsomia candida]|uniref:Gustatory receptor n=1 Tax=Folsomia candida TaxID=158441 RepID=A0A226DIG3_FOLCA|nr:hypothetical protein Fcan01_19886 [Folsomia candida]
MFSKGQSYFTYNIIGMKLNNLCYAIPYKYDDVSDTMQIIDPKSKRIYKVTLFLHVVYLFAMCAHLGLNRDKIPLPDILKAVVVIITYSICIVCRITYYVWEKEGLLLLNGFLHFERKFLNEFPILDTKIRKGATFAKMVFVMGTVSCASFGIVVPLQLFRNPCTPPYIGSMRSVCLLPTSPHAGLDVIALIGILFDAFMYFHVAQPAALMIGNYLLGFGCSLQEYLGVIGSQTTRIRIKAFVTPRIKENFIKKSFRIYSQCQILVKQIDVVFKNLFIPGVYAVASNGIVFSLYVCIRMHSTISIAGLSFFVMLLIDFLMTVGLDLASMGNVNLKSSQLTEKWKNMEGFGRRSEAKRISRSFQPLKIRFGSNFIDHLTSLTVLDHCLSLTVSLLLIS